MVTSEVMSVFCFYFRLFVDSKFNFMILLFWHYEFVLRKKKHDGQCGGKMKQNYIRFNLLLIDSRLKLLSFIFTLNTTHFVHHSIYYLFGF